MKMKADPTMGTWPCGPHSIDFRKQFEFIILLLNAQTWIFLESDLTHYTNAERPRMIEKVYMWQHAR